MDKDMSTTFGLSKTLKRTSLLASRTVRIAILGQAAVGKTAMAVRFITRRFIGEYDPTLGTETNGNIKMIRDEFKDQQE